MRLPILGLIVALAACSPAPAPPANETTAPPAPIESVIPPGPTPSPAAIELDAVTEAAAGALKGELRCAFLSDASILMLVGAGDVDAASRATAVVMRSGKPVLLTARETGGFDAMARGGSFAGEGLTASITRGAARETEHEGSSHTATLSVEAPGSAPQAIDGVWECGP
ncbi:MULTISPECIES: hypothetical protein [unclassified Sphingomonas]|uniref:hypothetical protein n=1 Tax=unclassified Sphingomonas TaxID=196159 RepID=UPI00215161C6|nr:MULTISPECIES: hypothetical protein [unclassified Sphingomonas]MCR5869902.1 hypothetical protein [Sphingomonas sp. J344]UUX98399.1 hypothetical protein LRS08_12550 [Sphingomonas sp. J315]